MQNIYREQLLEHMKNPYNKGSIKNATVSVKKKNTMCGDIITVQLKVDEDSKKIKDAMFDGECCGVCTASASMLTEEIIDESLEHAQNLQKEDVLQMLSANLTTSRIKCAELPLDALKECIKQL